MQTYQLSCPESVRIEDIQAALALIGEFRLTAKRQAAPKPERVYQEPVIARKPDGSERELDGIEVESRIKKLMSELKSAMNHDGRSKHAFPTNYEIDTASYTQLFCTKLSHVKAVYQLGDSTFEA